MINYNPLSNITLPESYKFFSFHIVLSPMCFIFIVISSLIHGLFSSVCLTSNDLTIFSYIFLKNIISSLIALWSERALGCFSSCDNWGPLWVAKDKFLYMFCVSLQVVPIFNSLLHYIVSGLLIIFIKSFASLLNLF